MNRPLAIIALFGLTFGLPACDQSSHDHGGAHSHDHGHGHDHDHGHDHSHGHDHDHDHAGHHDHGDKVDLGDFMVGQMLVKGSRRGDMMPGSELVVDITIDGEQTVDAVRAWVGVKEGTGSVKAKLDLEGGTWHGHLEVPRTLPEDAALWVEIENEEGRSMGNVALDA